MSAPRDYRSYEHVVVTTRGRHGTEKLHAFVRLSGPEASPVWKLLTPPSRKQRTRYDQLRRQLIDTTDPTTRVGDGTWTDDDADDLIARQKRIHRALLPSSGEVDAYDSLGAARLDLGAGVTPQGSTLAVILDALHAAGRTTLDRDDLKVVLSQLGSRITHLHTLPDEQRRHAQPALYSQIVARCTTVTDG